MKKRHYVVRTLTGYVNGFKNKKEALEELRSNGLAEDLIYTSSQCGNYWHDRIRVIEAV